MKSYFIRDQPSNQTVVTPPTKHSSTHKGAIAGGIVGGFAGLVILALLAYLLYRRRQRVRHLKEKIGSPSPIQWGQQRSEIEANGRTAELRGGRHGREVAEKDGMGWSEMGSGVVAACELEGRMDR